MTTRTRTISLVTIAVAALGCSSEAETSSEGNIDEEMREGHTVEFVNDFGDSGDAESLQRFFEVHEARHPLDTIVNTSFPDYFGMLTEMRQRTQNDNPPDVFMGAIEDIGPFNARSLDDFFSLPEQSKVLPNLYSELVADVTIDGEVYALPWTVTCQNTFFYNKHLFAENNLEPPTNLSELQTACQHFRAQGITPLGVPGANMALQALLAAAMGVEEFRAYLEGQVDEAALSSAVDAVAQTVEDCVDPSTVRGSFLSSVIPAEDLMSGQTAMVIYLDWLENTLLELGWTPGVDYGMGLAPGNHGLFSYFSVNLMVPENAPHLQGAMNFLDTAASVEGRVAFEESRGGISPRIDQDISTFNEQRQGLINEMKQADNRMTLALPMLIALENAMTAFIQSEPHDKDALLQALLNIR